MKQMDVVYDMYLADHRRHEKLSGDLNDNLLNGILYYTREGIVYVAETEHDIHLMDYNHYMKLVRSKFDK